MVKKNKDEHFDINNINNLWEFLAFFFQYILIKHLWKILIFIIVSGLIWSGYTLSIGGFNFQKEQIKVKGSPEEIR